MFERKKSPKWGETEGWAVVKLYTPIDSQLAHKLMKTYHIAVMRTEEGEPFAILPEERAKKMVSDEYADMTDKTPVWGGLP